MTQLENTAAILGRGGVVGTSLVVRSKLGLAEREKAL